VDDSIKNEKFSRGETMRVRNNNHFCIVCFLVLFCLLTASLTFGQVYDDTVYVWYGNLDEVPIVGIIGDTLLIDVYLYTTENAYLGDLHLCLGAMDQFVDSFLVNAPHIHCPIFNGDVFSTPEGSPPNPPGWSSQSFGHWVDLMDPIWIHFDIPTLIISYQVLLTNDSLLAGDTIECLGPGLSSRNGSSGAGDTLGLYEYPIVEYFSPILFAPLPDSCHYVPGDFDCDCIQDLNGNTITYMIRYFKGVAEPPPCSCWNSFNNTWLYAGGDVNGDCKFSGSDVLYLVAYFQGNVPELKCCPFIPSSCY
jgi:hypothetical protein